MPAKVNLRIIVYILMWMFISQGNSLLVHSPINMEDITYYASAFISFGEPQRLSRPAVSSYVSRLNVSHGFIFSLFSLFFSFFSLFFSFKQKTKKKRKENIN